MAEYRFNIRQILLTGHFFDTFATPVFRLLDIAIKLAMVRIDKASENGRLKTGTLLDVFKPMLYARNEFV